MERVALILKDSLYFLILRETKTPQKFFIFKETETLQRFTPRKFLILKY